jgi:Stage II sporulation protein E (SpoIIE)
MTVGNAPTRGAPPRPRPERRPARRHTPHDVVQLRLLVVGALVLALCVYAWPDNVPLSSLVLPMLVGSLILSPRHLPWFIVFNLVLVVLALTQYEVITARVGGAVLVLFVAGFIILLTSFRRSRLGVAGNQGESMLVDLRDRILGQGRIPELPASWYAESALRSAGGTPFAGDFIVTARPEGGDRLEIAVVDVSGKGEGAGTRALLMSGALGGLLGALPPEQFLPAANDFLLRQNWEEGFATAIHLSLDLATGDFELRSAGHPPAAQRAAGSGRWLVHAPDGPALGLLPQVAFERFAGRLHHGDSMVLYTDGLVESRGRDIALGIDQLLGEAEHLLRDDVEAVARRLVDTVGSPNDDRALLLVHRR